MSRFSRAKEIDRIWDELCRDPITFLGNRDPLEDELVECKGAIFREPLYDEIEKKPSDRILHDNLFRAIEAIAGMANTGGGIVIFGVVSARLDAFADDGKPISKRGMKAEELLDRYLRRERGIRFGKALVIGLDKEIPEEKEFGPADAPLDKYTQHIFGSESKLWGKHGHEGETLQDFNEWYEFVPKDAADEKSYPTVKSVLWRRAKWSEALGPHLFAGGRLLEVKDDKGNSRWIGVLKILPSDTPVYYISIPFPRKGKKHPKTLSDDTSREWPLAIPFRFPAHVKCYYLRDRAALQTLIERFGKGPIRPEEIFRYSKKGKDLIPVQFREELDSYVVPTADGERLPAKIKSIVDEENNLFILGESGLGKSLLMSYCFLNLELEGQTCFYSIDRTEGPDVYRTEYILCALREQTQRIEGMPKIEPPPQSESKAQWVWEKEYFESILEARVQIQPEQNLVIFLDALDENYLEIRESEFVLNVLKSLIRHDDLKVIWILSSQLRPGMDWIKDYFQILSLEGMGFSEAEELLVKHLPQKFDSSYPSVFKDLVARTRMTSGFHDPEMLVILGRAVGDKFGTVTEKVGFISNDALKSFLEDLPFRPREKYKWLFERYTEASKLRDIPSLKEHAEEWDKYIKSVSYTGFVYHILAILAFVRKPIPYDILAWALELEDRHPKQDYRSRPKYKFEKYPAEVIGKMNFLQTALRDLQRFVKVVEEKGENDDEKRSYSFCKQAVRESFVNLISKELKKSAEARLAQLAIEEIELVRKDNITERPSYLMLELFYLLSLKPESAERGLSRLLWLDCFPEWLQERACIDQSHQWITGLLQDLNEFSDLYLPSELETKIGTVTECIQDWWFQLNAHRKVIASFFRHEKRLRDIWPPKAESFDLLLPLDGYLRRINGHFGSVICLCVLHDGRLASGSTDHTIRIWDVDSGESKVLQEDEIISYLTPLPHDQLVSGSKDGTIQIWNVDTCESKVLRCPDLKFLDKLLDGRLVWSTDYHICVEDPDNGAYIFDMRDALERDRFTNLLVLSDGRTVLGTWDGKIIVMDLDTGEYTTIETDVFNLKCFAELVDGQLVFSGMYDDRIKALDLESGKLHLLRKFSKERFVFSLLPLSDSRLALCSDDDTIRIWNLLTASSQVLTGHSASVRCLAVLQDGRLASGSNDSTVRVWDLETGKSVILGSSPEALTILGLFSDGRLVAHLGNWDSPSELTSIIRIWDKDSEEIKLLEGHTGSVKVFVVLQDGRLASGSADNTIRIWEVDSGESKVLKGHGQAVSGLAVLPDGRLVSDSYDNTIRVWDTETGESMLFEEHIDSDTHFEKHGLQNPIIAILPDCRLASSGKDEYIRIRDLDTGELNLLEGHADLVDSFVVLSDGRLASLSYDGTIRIWDVDTGKSEILERTTMINRLAALPYGGLVGVRENNIVVWNLETREFTVLEGHERHIKSLIGISDRFLVSASWDRTVRVWDLNTNKATLGFLEANPRNLFFHPQKTCIIVDTAAGVEFFRFDT